MNNIRIFQIIAGILLIITGGAIFTIRADREFINLTPSEGSAFIVPITSGQVFEQTFTTQRKTISKIGAFMTPIKAGAKTSNGSIHIELLQEDNVVATGSIPVSRINNEGASLIRISPPIATEKGEKLIMRITVSPEATRLIALQKRTPDETFSNQDVFFTIDGVTQEYPVAYSAFESTWPPFIRQLGGLLVLGGLYLLANTWVLARKNSATLVAILAISALYAIPSFDTYRVFFPLVTGILIAYWWLLRVAGRSILASLFGACIFACSTWLPLYLITGGSAHDMLSLRDALVDPNQISLSHGAGGYIGVPAALFAVSGVLIWGRVMFQKRFTASQSETVMAVILFVSLYITFVAGPLQHSRAIIAVVFSLSWFASLAFDWMQRFLGSRDTFIQTLMIILFCISLLDLMHITAETFTYGLGS